MLPAKFNLGVRYDTGRYGFVSDLEYTLQSQNERSSLAGTDPNGMFQEVANIFGWQDSVTVRVGGEYRLGEEGELAIELGMRTTDWFRTHPTQRRLERLRLPLMSSLPELDTSRTIGR